MWPNDTPHDDFFVYVGGDSRDQQSATGSSARFNHPYSYKQQELDLEIGVKPVKHTELSVGYQREEIERDFQEVAETREDTFRVKLASRGFRHVSAGAKYAHSDRDASTYHGDDPFVHGHRPDYIATVAEAVRWENHPLLTRYYMADRDRDEVTGFLTIMPTDELSVGVNTQYTYDDYRNTELGLIDRRGVSYTVEGSYALNGWSAYTFYTFEKFKQFQEGWYFRGGGSKLPMSLDPLNRWTARDTDRIHSFGVGARMEVVKDLLDVGLDYMFSNSKDHVVVERTTVADPGFPNDKAKVQNLSARADYKVTDNLTMRMTYLFEKFDSWDWAVDDVDPVLWPMSQVIDLGETSPDYTASLGMLSFIYEFP